MCRILGITNYDFSRHKDLLKGFLKLAQTGKIPEGSSPGHLDGWGIGYYENGKSLVHKSAGPVIKEQNDFFQTLKKIESSPILIVHLRKSAWPKTTTKKNSHPFKNDKYLFAHNGTIFDYKNLLKNITIKHTLAPGALDSEVYFHYAINSTSTEIEDGFMKAAGHIRKYNKYSSLTCIFSDSDNLYAYKEFSKSPDYYTLFQAKSGNSHIICSEPISSKLNWELIKRNYLIVV